MKLSIRDLLLVTVILSISGCGNWTNGGAFDDTPSSVVRGQPVLIKMRLLLNGATPERYSDEEYFVRFGRSGDFKKLSLRRSVEGDEAWVECEVSPEEYKDADVVQYYLLMKCDGVENRLSGKEVLIDQPDLPKSAATDPKPLKP